MRLTTAACQASIIAVSILSIVTAPLGESYTFSPKYGTLYKKYIPHYSKSGLFMVADVNIKKEVIMDTPGDDFNNQIKIPASQLRSAQLTNVNDETVKLGDEMGSGTSLVIFLRHMGWPYCWSYAKEWCALQQELTESGVVGPLFISIGDEEKLGTFLELNPFIPKEQAFVDGYDFNAYKAAGFGRFDEQNKAVLEGVKMTAPTLAAGEWWKYASNVMKISPVPKDMKFGEIPEGVLRLGGTFVVNGNDVIYQWSDRVPGDHPTVDDVLKVAKETAAMKEKQFSIDSLFKNMFS